MNTLFSHLRLSAFICGSILLLGGCTSAVQSGTNTALSGVDLVQMTDDMAMQIVGDPQVQAAIAKEGQLRIVVNPVENRMRAEVLPQGQAEAFVARVRTLLSRHAPEKFTWIMNRDTFYRLRGRELEGVDLGPAPDAVSPDYSLYAKIMELPNRGTSYYLMEFTLTDLKTRQLAWTDSYEVKVER